jgi:predicted Fe-S protein YdhL (DUF1289 family)
MRCRDVCNQIQARIFSSMRMTKLPCQNKCKLDKEGICLGCNRTIIEIKEQGEKNEALGK